MKKDTALLVGPILILIGVGLIMVSYVIAHNKSPREFARECRQTCAEAEMYIHSIDAHRDICLCETEGEP